MIDVTDKIPFPWPAAGFFEIIHSEDRRDSWPRERKMDHLMRIIPLPYGVQSFTDFTMCCARSHRIQRLTIGAVRRRDASAQSDHRSVSSLLNGQAIGKIRSLFAVRAAE
jgi:hypothetical protein